MLLSKATYSALRLYIFVSMCVPWELNPQPFALLTQIYSTESQEEILDPWVQLMKNGGKNKSVAFIILVSV